MEDDANWKAEGAEEKRKEKIEATFWNVLAYVAQAVFWL